MVFQRINGWFRGILDTLFLPPGNSAAPEPIREQGRNVVAEAAPSGLENALISEPSSSTLGKTAGIDRKGRLVAVDTLTLAQLFFDGRRQAGLRTSGSLQLAKLRIRALPDELSVAGDLDLRQCQRLRRLGRGLNVLGNLKIGGRCSENIRWHRKGNSSAGHSVLKRLSRDPQCPLERLPEGLSVRGDLELGCCNNLLSLPKQCCLDGSLRIESCRQFRQLPDPFSVSKDLTLIGCPSLSDLPSSLQVGGSLRLVGIPIARLPERLSVGGDLILENCRQVTKLPEGLVVAGDLVIRGSSIRALPAGLCVGGNLVLDRCAEIEELPADLRVDRDIEVRRCAKFGNLAAGLKVQGSLRLIACPELRELPEGLAVPFVLSLAGCSAIESLPRDLRVGFARPRRVFTPSLSLNDCTRLTMLPDDLKVSGPIDLGGSGVSGLPTSLEKRVDLYWRGVVVRPAVILHPETLRAAEILGENNAELRRVMLERVGVEKVLAECKAKVLDEDRDPGGPRRLLAVRVGSRQHCYLHCRCPSTGRQYLLRVPPHIGACRIAAAWLAGFDHPDDYRPVQET